MRRREDQNGRSRESSRRPAGRRRNPRAGATLVALALLHALPSAAGADLPRLGPPLLPLRHGDAGFANRDRRFEAFVAEMDTRWEAEVASQEAKWRAFEAEVRAKWDAFVGPTREEWVGYSADRSARGRVHYERGEILVEVLIPAPVAETDPAAPQEPRLPPEAARRIEEEVAKLAAPDPALGLGPAEDQVRTADGETVTPENARDFVQREVLPKVVVEPGVVRGTDGVDRRKASVAVSLIPEHLRVRAARYRELVVAEADRFGLEPQLLFAIIQTESYFNPRARSPAPAYGLMQLVPHHGALEAQVFLNGKRSVPAPEQLYVPATNVTLGAAYVHLLHTRYLAGVEDADKRELLVLACYNWGPTRVRNRILASVPVGTLSAAELSAVLARMTPQETRDYVERVRSRKPLYNDLAGGHRDQASR